MTSHWTVAVLGLGYVGLPLAAHFAAKGVRVLGFDKDERKIQKLNHGRSYIPDVSSETLQLQMQDGRLTFSAPSDQIRNADYIIVTVPTPLDPRKKKPDLSALIGATELIGQHLQQGQTVIFESSTYPGTLEEEILPILEKKGLEVGKDFFLGYSPERIDPGNHGYDLQSIPKVVSGVTERCREKVQALYANMFDSIVPVSSPKVAEMCKLFENIQRLVNISLVNEIEQICLKLNVDFREALRAAATKPFGYTPYYPGPGAGGHCIPIDPLYFQWKASRIGMKSALIEAAANINKKMPDEIVRRIEQAVRSASGEKDRKPSVLLIGLTYKKDVNDTRESAAMAIMRILHDRNYTLNYYDPYVPDVKVRGRRYVSKVLTETFIREHDVVAILTDHSGIDWETVRRCAKAVVDTRGVLRTGLAKEEAAH